MGGAWSVVSAGEHRCGLLRQAPGLLRGPCVRFPVVCGDERVVIVGVWCLAEAAVLGGLSEEVTFEESPKGKARASLVSRWEEKAKTEGPG